MIKLTIYIFTIGLGISYYVENCNSDAPAGTPKMKYKGKYQNGEERVVEMINENYDKKYPKKN